ncbi:MAG: ferritin-like domain-containing protein [Polyangiaceae bacterium]
MQSRRIDIHALRSSILSAVGLGLGLTGCGALVVYESDGGSGGSGGTGPTSSQSSSSSGGTTNSGCVDPTPIIGPDGSDTGYVRCADGSVDRAAIGQCAFDWDPPPCEGNEDVIECTSNADCGLGGQCGHTVAVEGGTYCQCFYGCEVDDDCGSPDYACVCGGMLSNLPGSTCVPKKCATNADCDSGECGLGTFDDGCSRETFLACRGGADSCRTDVSCVNAGECSPSFDDASFHCNVPNCALGRPLVVEGLARVAPATERADWRGALRLSAGAPSTSTERYRATAALEHASIASFARFTLALLAQGAPLELVEEAQQAALDEIAHAKLAYGLGVAGPGALLEARAPLETDARALTVALVQEACVGETLGAMEASLAAENTENPALRAALEEVASDEARHAALGWRSLAWLLARDPSLVPVARAAFEREARLTSVPVDPSNASDPARGLPSPAAIEENRALTLREVVLPAAAQLFRLQPSFTRSFGQALV